MKRGVRKVMIGISLVGMLCVGIVPKASAKFWGWTTTGTTDWADGVCAYRETCRVHYIFWIAGEEECTTTVIDCLH